MWDVIVVGAGVEGSATAYQSAKAGYKTLLLEQFALPHTRGSSHGQSRIIRKAYSEIYYAEMMKEAYSSWATLENETETQLYTKTGLLAVSPTDSQEHKDVQNALARLNATYDTLGPKELKSRFPMLKLPSCDSGVYDPESGVLAADKALTAFQKQFVALGGNLFDGEAVTEIVPGDIVTVVTRSSTYRGRSLVLTAGPWTNKILEPLNLSLPLTPTRIGVYYWRIKDKEHRTDDYPTMIFTPKGEPDSYLLPPIDYPGLVKFCLHAGPEIDPDERDLVPEDSNAPQELLSSFIRKFIPDLNDKPSIVESCIYTMTPDEDFILDTHPKWKNIVIGAGFSVFVCKGHGFKMAPVVGKLLCELATSRRPSYDLTPFKISRFSTSKL